MRILVLLSLFLLSSCATGLAPDDAPLKLHPAGFSSLPGWEKDRHGHALQAFKVSCERILKKNPSAEFGELGGTYSDWQALCLEAANMDSREHRKARDFFEKHFRPWKVSAGRYSKGLFTGYYEPSLNGSLERHGPYQTPVHARPADLVMVDLGMFREDLKGKRIAGRVNGGRLHPFEDRAEIVAGKLPKESSEVIAWVDDPVGAFFLQIQGSGRIALDNGEVLRVGYAGQNGYPYYAIGRELIKRGQLTKENVSLQSIRAWLEAHPHRAAEIMNTNKSYVFFRVLDGPGPLGAEGVPLTQGRSLAVDRTKFTYGVPVWIDTQPPVKGYWPLQQLMIAQDTGGAIRGAVRGDVFWGHGERAERLAGHMKSKGEMWILLPVSVNL